MNGLFSSRYLLATCAYGLVRKVIHLRNAKIDGKGRYNPETKKYERERVPMLVNSKIMVLGLGVFIAPYLWPYYLNNDLSAAEIWLRKLDPEHYYYGHKEPSSAIEYLML